MKKTLWVTALLTVCVSVAALGAGCQSCCCGASGKCCDASGKCCGASGK